MIIAIANQKGGVGKTTTATALSAGLAKLGFTTLLIDTDPQGNASDTFCAVMEDVPTIYDVFQNGTPLIDVIQRTGQGDIVPGDLRMSAADMQFNRQGREFRLRRAIAPVSDKYDYIVIDTPPALGIITINALTAADTLIIPMSADRYSLQGIRQLSETIDTVREYSNPKLTIRGILLTRFNARTVLSRDIKDTIEEFAGTLGTVLFHTAIRQGISIQESQTLQKSIFEFAPGSTTSADYGEFISELLEEANV